MTPPAHLAVVGLGNPGADYAHTRHNVGQMVVDELATRTSATLKAHKSRCLVDAVRIGDARVELAKPMSYMNQSGGPVSGLLSYFGIAPTDLIVVHDDLDLPFAQIRLKRGGGHGGHNGLRDIMAATGTKDFTRVRFGIGRPPGRQSPADFVLRPFASAERDDLAVAIQTAADAVEDLIREGLQAAQQRYHAPNA